MDEDLNLFFEDQSSQGSANRPKRRVSLHDQIVSALRTMVLDGRVPPGTRISETALCDELDVSRTPLREALKVLASEGLVELLPNRGAVTTTVTVEETQDVFEVMQALESMVGRLAAMNASDDTLQELEAMHKRLQGFHKRRRRAEYFRLNQQIHKKLAAASGNTVLLQTYSGLSDKVRRARALANYSLSRWDASMEEHEEIMAALRRRDPEALAGELTRHAERTGEAVIAELREIA